MLNTEECRGVGVLGNAREDSLSAPGPLQDHHSLKLKVGGDCISPLCHLDGGNLLPTLGLGPGIGGDDGLIERRKVGITGSGDGKVCLCRKRGGDEGEGGCNTTLHSHIPFDLNLSMQ